MAPNFQVMRDGVVALALLAFLWLIAAKLNGEAQTAYTGRFHAADGDSLAIGDERMRLKNIDAPELGQTCEREGRQWACGRQAKEALQALVDTRDTKCEGHERDRFQRLLVVCKAGGIDFNARMVRQGFAVSYGGYGAEEAQARAEKAGMWAGNFEMPRDVRDREHGARPETRKLFGW